KSERRAVADALGLDIDVAGSWISFWAGVHDVGKANPGFQRKWPPGKAALEHDFHFPPENETPHGIVTAAVVAEWLIQRGVPCSLAFRIGTAVGGHHGTFPRAEETEAARVGDSKWKAARAAILDSLAEITGVAGAAPPRKEEVPHWFLM